jgi:hypothetical protein
MRYGLRVAARDRRPSAEQVMAATRDAGFGDEVKRRIILGTYALSSGYYDAYYGSAQKVRRLIADDFAAAFEQADVLVSPTAPTTAFRLGAKLDDPLAMYLNDIATIPANLAGVPACRCPAGLADEDGLPVGLPDPRPGHGRRAPVCRGRGPRAAHAAWGGPCSPKRLRCPRPPTRRPESWRRRPRPRPCCLGYDDLAAYDPVLGLEVHVELGTAPRCSAAARPTFGAEPNTQVCPVCLGLPGRLPVVNGGVESAIRIGLALNCEIAPWCRFARKNYFYPDMPKNFQTSSTTSRSPSTATSTSNSTDGTVYRVEIERAHMEEDTGKSTARRRRDRSHPRRRRTRSSTTTGPASRSSRSSPSRSSARGSGRRSRQGLCRAPARPAQGARRLRREDGAGLHALRRQPLA